MTSWRAGAAPPGENKVHDPARDEQELVRIVTSLVNKNSRPEKRDLPPKEKVFYPLGYDWSEERRVRDAIQKTIESVDETWPLLAKSVSYDHYCVTIQLDDSAEHYSVGFICRKILSDTLQYPYLIATRSNERLYKNVRSNPITSRLDFPEWMLSQHRNHKTLADLQVDMCEWAASKIDAMSDVNEDEKSQVTSTIRVTIDQLKSTKRPIVLKSITVLGGGRLIGKNSE